MKTKVFYPGIPVHSYEKGEEGEVLFYCLRDRLVYFTIFCVEAVRHGIVVLTQCLMFNHTHSLTKARSYLSHYRFHQAVESQYAKAFNEVSSRNGRVFKKPFGWSMKRSDAKVKDCLAYHANNPVVKKLCKKGVDDQWTFLAYGASDHPFSSKIIWSQASAAFRKGARLVKAAHGANKPLGYALLATIYRPLNPEESRQMTDFIIKTYCVIDFKEAASYFGGYDKMIAAFDVISGSEYDITEDFIPEPDLAYREMVHAVKAAGYDLSKKRFLSIDGDAKLELVRHLLQTTSASPRQVSRFLHLRTKAKENHKK